jgi:hypothetical protein
MNVYLPFTSRLPSSYQEVEYIQGSGSQYIDTWLKPNLTHSLKYEWSFNYSNVTTRQVNGIQWFRYIWVVNWYYQIAEWQTWHTNIVATPNRFNEFIVKFFPTNKLQYQIEWVSYNWNSYETYSEDYSNTWNISIFSLNGWLLPSSCKIKYRKIYIDEVLQRDFVPCYRKSDSVIWMYDLVNNQFYTNSWTGIFTKGSDVVLCELQNAYIGNWLS